MERNLTRAFGSILGSRIGVVLIGVVTAPVLVRLLGSANYGDYALVLSVMSMALPVLASGTFNGIRKFVAEDRPEPGWRSAVFGFYTRVTVVLCAIAAVALLVGIESGLVGMVFGPRFEYFFLLLIALLFVRSFAQVGRGALMGLGLEHYSEPLRVLERFVFAVVGLYLVYVGWGVGGALVGLLVAITVVLIVTIKLLSSRLSLAAILRRAPASVAHSDLLSFGVDSVLLALLTVSLYNVDILLLQPMGGASQTGYYKAALVVAEFLWFVPMAIQYTLVQSVSELWFRGEHERVERIAGRVVRYSGSLLLLLILGVAALAHRVIPLYYGEAFTPAVVPLYLLLPGVLGFALARPIFAIGQGIGKIRILVKATGVAALANLTLNLVLIPEFGMYGAAVATSFSYGSMLLLHVVAARRIGYRPLNDLRGGRILVTAVATAPVIFGLDHLLASTVLALVAVPPAGLVVFGTIALRVELIEVGEVEQLLYWTPAELRSTVMRFVRFVA